MTDKARTREIHAALAEIAPFPAWDGSGDPMSAQGVARYLLVQAQVGWTRDIIGFIHDDAARGLDPAAVALVSAQFAAGFALRALDRAAPAAAAEAAAQIRDAWNDGGGVGEWLWELLGEETAGVVESLAKELKAATPSAVALEAELAMLRRGGETLGKVVVHQSRSMRAAWIEMRQNGPAAAMQWILNSIPDVDDDEPEDQWNGTESAREWLDRTDEKPAGRP